MKSLVLGSSGQIGAALMDFLAEQGDTAIPFDIVRTPSEDLRIRSDELDAVVEQADFVYFLAFDVGGSVYLEKFQNSFEFIQNNAKIMANVFEAIHRNDKPFIFASSQMSNMSYSGYGVMKAVGEKYTQALGGLTVKFWNVYGIEHDAEKAHVITDFIRMAMDDKKIKMRTDGLEERQFLFSRDCCEALTTLAHAYDRIPRDAELHVTSYEWTSIMEIAKIVSALFDNAEIIPGNRSDTVQENKKNPPAPFIKDYWHPKTSLNDGIRFVASAMTGANDRDALHQ